MDEFTREEIIPTPERPKELSGSTKDVYCQLLGEKEFPKSPEEMPERVFLSPEVLGDLEEAILKTTEDGNECYQFVRWDEREQKFKKSKLIQGSPEGVEVESSKKQPKALVSFHTHPRESGIWFSETDIAWAKSLPWEAFIFIVGKTGGFWALFQTEKSARLHKSEIFTRFRVLLRLKMKKSLLLDQVKIFEDEGFKLYQWDTGTGAVRKGDLEKGVTIYKV